MHSSLFSSERTIRPSSGGRSRDASPAPSSFHADLRQFSYVSFPETTGFLPSRSQKAQPTLGTDHSLGFLPDPQPGKSLLGRFKSAIGASAWISPATTSEHKTSTIALPTHPSLPPMTMSYSQADLDSSNSFDSRKSRAKKISLNQSSSRSFGGSLFEPSDSSRAQNMESYQYSHPQGLVGSQHRSSFGHSESPPRPGSSMSFRALNRSVDGLLEAQRPASTALDSSRAPFHFNSLPEPENAFPLVSSDTLLRSLVLDNSGGNHSADFSAVPPFSHIPGFPLARETVGDDSASVFSSSGGPSSTPKKIRPNNQDPSHNLSRETSSRLHAIGNPQGKGLSKEYWLPDKDVRECYDCAVAFTSWRRKHHCRICGAIFCSQCASNLVPGNRFASSGYIRVCNICLAKLEPQSQEQTNFAIREDTDDETQSFSEAASGFNLLASRSQGNRAHTSTPGKMREAARQVGDQLASSVTHRTGRSLYRNPPDHHSARRKSLLRQLAPPDKTRSKFHSRSDSPPVSRSSPITANLFSPLTIKRSSLQKPEAVSSAPFRKGLTDEEQAGLPGISTANHTQSVYVSSPNTSKLSAEIKEAPLDRHFSSSSHETNHDSSQNGERHEQRLPSTSRNASGSYVEGQPKPCLASELPFSKAASASFVSETEQSLRLEESFSYFPAFSCEHVRFMIHQFLTRENIPKTPVWETELTNLLLQLVSEPPRPKYDAEDAGDIRRLVKIKRIPGGQVADCEYIHGVVFTKNIAHRKMKSECSVPKVLTIGMPIEFQRVDGYCKLDVLVSQERQYLKGLVHRLISLEPDLVLVDGNVSGVAIDYFVEAGVTVLRHVKSTVLQAVARSTKTPLISSLDKLLNLQVGQCDLFRVQTVHHRMIPNHHKKTFIRLEGCEPSLGGTLILRGGDLALLTKVKSLMCSMVGIIYSLRLEDSFLNDEGAIYSNDSTHETLLHQIRAIDLRTVLSRFRHAKKHICNFEPLKLPGKPGGAIPHSDLITLSDQVDDLIKPYECLLPSGSPRVNLTPPFALLKLRQLIQQLIDLIELDTQSIQPLSAKSCLHDEKFDEKLHPERSPSMSLTSSHTKSNDSNSILSDEATTRVRQPTITPDARDEYISHLNRQIEEERMAVHFYLSNHSSETFKAADHQQLIVQESVTCSSLGGYTCQGPHLRAFAFYSAGDQSVGQIIQMLINCRSEICHAKGCNQPKSIHQTNWIHGHYKATIQMHLGHSNRQSASSDSEPSDPSNFPEEPLDPDLIMMQGYCPKCEGYTRRTPMSDDAWRLSLGKYLQLCLYSPGLVSNLMPGTPRRGRLSCSHDAHLEHLRMFFYQGFRVDFRLQKINVYEAIPPSLVLFTPSQALIKVREEEYEIILRRSEAFFNSVRSRIVGFNYKVVSLANQDASEEAMRDLLKKVDVDSNAVKAQLNEVYEECVGTNGVKMNIVRKTLIDKAVEWDGLFATFESRFVATDGKDARRLASVPLKKIFLDQSMPGSPERLFPRISQAPSLNSQKYNYNSQSEVESDHAPKGQSFGTFKKTFPSPTLKSMASALAFALPSSMPGIGIPEIRSDGEKLKNHVPHPLGPPLCVLQPSQEVAPKDGLMLDSNPGVDASNDEPHSSGELSIPQKSLVELSIPSVVIEPASTPTSTASNTQKAGTNSNVESHDPKGKLKDATEISAEIQQSPASTSNTQAGHASNHRISLLTASRHDSYDLEPQPNEGTHPDLVSDKEEDSKSDSTVVNVRSGVALSSHSKGSDSQRKKCAASDTDTTTSELDLPNDSRRMTLRSRRPKDLVLNSRGGVANLVQKFESPKPSPRKATRSNSPVIDESVTKSSNAEEGSAKKKPLKTNALPIRPSFRRGKSEIVRSTMNVLRGKKPSAGLDKAGSHIDCNQSFDSSTPRLSGKQSVQEHIVRVPSRTQRPSSRITSPRTPSSHVHSHRSPMQRSGTNDGASSAEKPRVPSSPRGLGLKKEFAVPRRARHESGLPVSNFYLHRRMNMNTKVTTIARHFDRMSRDAERERIKQANEHRSRPRPIAHAKSSVQAFSSLTAAVNEDSDSDIDECEGHPAGHDADDEGDVIPEAYGPDNLAQGGFKAEPGLSTDLPLVPEVTPAGPHPSPDLDHIDQSYLDEASTSNRPLSPSRVTSCSPPFLTDTSRLPPLAVAHFSDNEMSSSDTGRHSIIKTLSSLWNYQGAEFLPLEYPQLPTEHQSAENPVIIREDEPSSIIAYTLASKLYQATLKETEPRVVERSEIFMPEEFKPRSNDIDSTWGMIDFMSDDLDVDDVLKIPMNRAKPMQFRFDVTPCTITCKVFFMHQFEALRKTLICKDIVESLARCHKWDASGGKSGQKFLKTKDERYLIKGISKAELEALTKFAPAYFEYLSSAIKEKRPITLAKMFGIFQVSFVNKITNRKGRLQVQVIENLWVTKPHLQIYDLKGLTRNRTVNVTGKPHEVLLDGNFCEMVRTTPILVRENSLLRLQASLHNDTLFLANHNVMDYSLAVGFDEEKQEMYIGIIGKFSSSMWIMRSENLNATEIMNFPYRLPPNLLLG
ncbi:1-phosphatidylinositol-3-phosphate 5-kinase [Puccinia graminis f. sp. tritici]|uniref:1-phosphatidylinositol-3-phosphate 5-kinase n=1 Tax=Puccinia graminis f. sp. tritici TaxID=56615 RepID=A0A5B0R1Q7_PUCGR|nr:1-phosphatidylinositol-3-phosphate 5-kinase [Puccinia graminis f. sp. tritici]